ncbi:hypothetical protein BDV26DRAFT_87285 [Aspergillus bertholletiae]|uniref:Uncharacterized protein n=1 Tax=Aspergillus bertholletiae TaxID=1226010 RepID=A0A5N7ASP4_9EURO|nr:hypothetical protein BDV26DRAFT_87285 [Aspergillus bertholletiae]
MTTLPSNDFATGLTDFYIRLLLVPDGASFTIGSLWIILACQWPTQNNPLAHRIRNVECPFHRLAVALGSSLWYQRGRSLRVAPCLFTFFRLGTLFSESFSLWNIDW